MVGRVDYTVPFMANHCRCAKQDESPPQTLLFNQVYEPLWQAFVQFGRAAKVENIILQKGQGKIVFAPFC